MFKLSAIGCNTRKKTPTPLLDRRINYALIKFIPHLHDTLSQFTMLFTDDREMPSSRAICLCVLCVWGLSSWLSTRSSTSLMLSTVRTVRLRPLPGRLAAVPVVSIFLISLFNPPNDHPFWGNSFRNFLAPYCLFCLKNCIEILSSSLNAIL
jgi:hypothetical protein